MESKSVTKSNIGDSSRFVIVNELNSRLIALSGTGEKPLPHISDNVASKLTELAKLTEIRAVLSTDPDSSFYVKDSEWRGTEVRKRLDEGIKLRRLAAGFSQLAGDPERARHEAGYADFMEAWAGKASKAVSPYGPNLLSTKRLIEVIGKPPENRIREDSSETRAIDDIVDAIKTYAWKLLKAHLEPDQVILPKELSSEAFEQYSQRLLRMMRGAEPPKTSVPEQEQIAVNGTDKLSPRKIVKMYSDFYRSKIGIATAALLIGGGVAVYHYSSYLRHTPTVPTAVPAAIAVTSTTQPAAVLRGIGQSPNPSSTSRP